MRTSTIINKIKKNWIVILVLVIGLAYVGMNYLSFSTSDCINGHCAYPDSEKYFAEDIGDTITITGTFYGNTADSYAIIVRDPTWTRQYLKTEITTRDTLRKFTTTIKVTKFGEYVMQSERGGSSTSSGAVFKDFYFNVIKTVGDVPPDVTQPPGDTTAICGVGQIKYDDGRMYRFKCVDGGTSKAKWVVDDYCATKFNTDGSCGMVTPIPTQTTPVTTTLQGTATATGTTPVGTQTINGNGGGGSGEDDDNTLIIAAGILIVGLILLMVLPRRK